MEFYFSPPSARETSKFFIWALFVLNIIFIFFIWWTKSAFYIHNSADGNLFVALGRITGLLGEYFLLTELVLIGRIEWIEGVFGFDKLNKFHRYIGYSILSLLLAHPILLTLGYAKNNSVGLVSQFADFLANTKDVFAAYIGLILLIFVVIISIVIVRKKLRYETWYFTHLFTYLAIGLALNHQLETGDLRNSWPLFYWYVINFSVFGLVLLYRFVRPLFVFNRHRFKITNVVKETDNTWSIYISGKKMEKFIFEAGQYANINILAKGLWYSHPFSFSSAYNGEYIRFSIKSLGDYTAQIAKLKIGTRVVIDGPLGLFVEKLSKREKYLFIAGGIGITPIRGMIESLTLKNKDICLLYANRTEKDIIFKRELDDFCNQNQSLKINYIVKNTTTGLETGYIDKAKIVRLVPDFYDREVFLCGPKTMMELVISDLKELGFNSENIHYEDFSF